METNAPATKGNESAQDRSNSPSIPPLPKPNTQPSRLLSYLVLRRQINPLQGWIQLGIYRLSDTVAKLRKLGWSVETELTPVLNGFSEECMVALYRLDLSPDAANDAELVSFVSEEQELMTRRRSA